MPTSIEEAFAPVIGLPAWGVKIGHGSFLTMEFGDPTLEIVEPRPVRRRSSPNARRSRFRRLVYVRGNWHLWIYCCHWRLLIDNQQMAWSEDSNALLDAAAAEIDGQKLTQVSFDVRAGTSSFDFDLGARLETWPYEDNDLYDIQWKFFDYRDETVLVTHADGRRDWQPLHGTTTR